MTVYFVDLGESQLEFAENGSYQQCFAEFTSKLFPTVSLSLKEPHILVVKCSNRKAGEKRASWKFSRQILKTNNNL